MGRGLFVVFEGGDASGKSTQARRCAERYGARFAFEPGDTALGVDLRRWVLDAATGMTPNTEALIMLADRAHHVDSIIEPTLASGRSVVCDRFFASTLAYQGYGRGVNVELLRAATDLAIGACRPDVTILIDVPLEVANERRAFDSNDRFESAEYQFHQRVRDGYLELASSYGDTWWVVDGSLDENEVAEQIEQRLSRLSWSHA